MENKPLNEDGNEENPNNEENNRPSSPDKLLPQISSAPDNTPNSIPDSTNDLEPVEIDESKVITITADEAEAMFNMDQSELSNTNQSDSTHETNQSESSKENGNLQPDSPSEATTQGSPRVQFGAGTKEGDGARKGVQRVRRSFKDIVLTEVIKADPQELASKPLVGGPGKGTPPKGILKVRSEPALLGSDKSQSYINKAYEEDGDNHHHPGDSTPISTTSRSASPFLKRSLASPSHSTGHGFADVVDLLIQRTSLDFGGRDVHPFGRDCSIEGIMQASRPKSHSKNSAFSKLVIWFTLLSFLLGAAFGVIFLSENYNAMQRSAKILKASLNNNTKPA